MFLYSLFNSSFLAGYRLIDTAYSYKNEKDIGITVSRLERAGKISRKDLFITTKVPPVYLNPKDVKLCVEESLDNLRSKYIDLLLIHSPWGMKNLGGGNLRPIDKDGNYIFEHHDIVDTWKAFEDEVQSGRVRSIGMSNCTANQMLKIMKNTRIIPQNAQFECHAYNQQNKLREFCRNNGITCTSFGSLGSAGRPAHHTVGDTMPVLLDDKVVTQIADKYRKKNSQILLRFMLETGLCVIPKSEKLPRLEENIAVFDFSLEDIDTRKLQQLDRGRRYFPFVQYQSHPEYTKSGEQF